MLYAVIIVLAMICIALINIFLVADGFGYAFYEIILWTVVATLAEFAVQAVLATIARRCLPKSKFEGVHPRFCAGEKECRCYERLGIKRWKDKVLELGCFTRFRKNRIADPNDNAYVLRYITEANYGVACHVACIAFGWACVFCAPVNLWLTVGLPVYCVGALLNLPPLFILRYNLVKLHKLYRLNEKKAARAKRALTERASAEKKPVEKLSADGDI